MDFCMTQSIKVDNVVFTLQLLNVHVGQYILVPHLSHAIKIFCFIYRLASRSDRQSSKGPNGKSFKCPATAFYSKQKIVRSSLCLYVMLGFSKGVKWGLSTNKMQSIFFHRGAKKSRSPLQEGPRRLEFAFLKVLGFQL